MEKTSQAFLPCNLGRTKQGGPFVLDLQQVANMLIVQPNSEKKASFLSTVMQSLASSQSSDDIRFLYLGNNTIVKDSLRKLENLDYCVSCDEAIPETTNDLIISVFNLMTERYETLKQYGKSIVEYNSMTPSEKTESKMSYVVIFIDEIQEILTDMNKDVIEKLGKIATFGQPCEIYVISSTSYPTPDELNGFVKVRLGQSRVVFKVSSLVDSLICLDGQGAELLSDEEALYQNKYKEDTVFYPHYLEQNEP